ncbi:MAG: CocE/NonD family hydrolase [Deltaproteobacteria bacterium]|nr:CocE/NonD family hydrolase [Deltaproteobacteria bacterium]
MMKDPEKSNDTGKPPYEGSQIQYDVVVEKNITIPMRDGTRLAADIYRPALGGRAIGGKFPAILERTPYNKEIVHLVTTAKFFAVRGYVSVMQDVRGRFQSEGEWSYLFLKNEREDGYDTVEWIAAQPWSDGQVGTIGGSYSTQTQQALAVMNPPHLKAQFHLRGGYNYHTRGLRNCGAFMYGTQLVYIWRMAQYSKEADADPLVQKALDKGFATIREWYDHFPLKKGASPLKYTPGYEKWFLEALSLSDYDDCWKQAGGNIEEFIDEFADVPVYLQTAWYDHHTWANTVKYLELTKRHKTPKRLLIGTWLHGPTHYEESFAGNVDFGPDARLDNLNDLRLKWFDHWLKGMKTDIMEGPPIKIFVMGGGNGRKNREGRLNHGGRWRHENEWPLARTRFTTYYLHADGSLTPNPPAQNDPPSSYTFDPHDPVPSIGGSVHNEYLPGLIDGGGWDQRGQKHLFTCKGTLPLAARSDVLVFETPPLDEDMEVTGPLVVKLWASSSAVDTDFTAKLIDVYPPGEDYPDGYALNLTDGIVRARYRNIREKAEFMTPGKIYEFTIEPQPTSNLFKAGHRIRLDISSSNFPHFDVNPNTGGPLGTDRKMIAAHNTIYHDADHPSHIVLPIIPAEQP